MKKEYKKALKTFLIEFIVYAVLVAGYFLLVLHLLGGWLNEMFRDHRSTYAFVALALIIGQGVLLDALTRLLLSLIKPATEAE